MPGRSVFIRAIRAFKVVNTAGTTNTNHLTDAQCSIPNSHPMRIENWELRIGQMTCLCVFVVS
jgi:hypothetical protein